jgi:alpha-beta hydrolase superfamily lysophospholipase
MKKIQTLLSVTLITVLLAGCGSQTSTLSSITDDITIQGKDKNFIPLLTSAKDWGSHSQIGGTYEDMLDVKGNRDGIWENEDDSPGTVNGIGTNLPFKPWLERKSEGLKAALSTTNVIREMSDFLNEQERRWQQPVTALNTNSLKTGKLFAVQKAIALTRMGRTPDDVTEGFVNARGTVNGTAIQPRQIFWQRFKPTGNPNGKLIVISPGFQETGRNFYEQVTKLNQQGNDVILMDHQWAGQTNGGEPGGLDRGFGVARDVAAVAAFANGISQQEYGNIPGHEVILFGNSMGAGPGVLGAMVLNDNGKIRLEGSQMPVGLKAVLQAPFLATSSNIINSAITLFSKVPFARDLQLYSTGLPVLTHNKTAAQKGTQVLLMEDVRAQLQTMSAATQDINFVMNMIKAGQGPKGRIAIVHGDHDPLAEPEKSSWLAKQLGSSQVTLNMINSDNHVLEQSPAEQNYAVNVFSRL